MSLVNTARRLDTRSSQRMAKLSSQSPYHDIQVTFVGEAGNVRDAGETLRAGMQLEAWLQLPRDWRHCQLRLTCGDLQLGRCGGLGGGRPAEILLPLQCREPFARTYRDSRCFWGGL